MGVGFCVMVDSQDVDAALALVTAAGGSAQVIGQVVADPGRRVHLDQYHLVGEGGQFLFRS